MKQELEETIKELEAILPGIGSRLEGYGGADWGLHWSGWPEGVAYAETGKYHVVAAKWEEHVWSESGGGIQWNEYLTVQYAPKDDPSMISRKKVAAVVTRDMYDPDKDERHLWGFKGVSIDILADAKVKVSWTDAKNEKGPYAVVDLD